MEQPKKKNPKQENKALINDLIEEKKEPIILKDKIVELMVHFAVIEKGNREVDLSVGEAMKLLNQVASLASFIEKAIQNKKK